MSSSVLLGFWRYIIRIPGSIWERGISRDTENILKTLDFMTEDHHRIRDFAVLEIPRHHAPIPQELIAEILNLPGERVKRILDELEKNMTFLYRNQNGAVNWAYPVTTDQTPHQITFNSGEQTYAA